MFGRKERKHHWVREPLTKLEDLRDDCIAVFRDSGMTMREVHQAGGPTPQTISKWLYKETRFPRLDSVRALLQALGHELMPMPKEQAAQIREQGRNSYLHLDIPTVGAPRMPRRKSRG